MRVLSATSLCYLRSQGSQRKTTCLPCGGTSPTFTQGTQVSLVSALPPPSGFERDGLDQLGVDGVVRELPASGGFVVAGAALQTGGTSDGKASR